MNELQKTFAAVKSAMNWMGKANCRNMDVEIFFPDVAASYNPFAREVCNDCPVSEQCLWYANETHADTGMFAGMSPTQRQNWRRDNKIELGMSKEAWENKFKNYLRSPVSEWSKP
jgi:WhiB family redox-sensing transcriptional regulator